jgi:hypothetical protein
MTTTTSARKPRQRRSHTRTVKVLSEPTAADPRTFIRLTQDGKASHYWVSPLTSDFGRAFRFEKPEGDADAYDVLLEQGGDSCTCKGHTHHGYCKHVDCCRALLGAGKVS